MCEKCGMRYTEHKRNWKNCELCDLCDNRSKVVLCRGKIPCDILLVGEAPGWSEDSIGKPFIGPAGQLLDKIMENAWQGEVRYALTNLVACIPIGDNHQKTMEPDKDSIKACGDRLRELIHLARPKGFVCVGKLAESWLPKIFKGLPIDRTISIVHPAAILRVEEAQYGITVQRCTIALRDFADEIL